MYHEATAINLLETLLFHRDACEALSDQAVDLIDYCTRKLNPLVSRYVPHCVMVCATETWAVRVEEEQRMERNNNEMNDNVMLRCMCDVTLRDKVPMVELRRRLGIEGVVEVMRRCKLRWFRHVERKKVDD